MVKYYTFRKSEVTEHGIYRQIYSSSSRLYMRGKLSEALIRGLPTKRRLHVVSFNPTMLSKTIQHILLGETILSLGDNEYINAVSENRMATIAQRMDERLDNNNNNNNNNKTDRLEDLLNPCQLSRTDQKNQPLQGKFSLICRACGVNGHKASECSRSSYGNALMVNQRFNNNPRNYNNFPYRRYNNFYSQCEEIGNGMGANTFHPRAIRGSYNPRYYKCGIGRGYNRNYNQNNGFQKTPYHLVYN